MPSSWKFWEKFMSIEKIEPTAHFIEKPTLKECREALNQLYGDNYTLGDHHVVLKGGFFGFGQKQWIRAEYFVNEPRTAAVPSRPAGEPPKSDAVNPTDLAALQFAMLNQIKELKTSIGSKIDDMVSASAAQASDKHPAIQKIEEMLAENEFTLSYINGISTRIREHFSLDELDDFGKVEQSVVDWIGQTIAIAPKPYRKCPHVIVLVGPTGVGKTTTVAKIAANIILDAKNSGKPPMRVRMITVDRTRVGAEEQLRRYGEIMNVSVDKAESAEDLRQIFDEHKDSLDALIIDTSGYSPNDHENIAKMCAFLDVPGLNPDVYLTVTASTKPRDLVSIMQHYEPFNIASVIVTKCDETVSFGNVLSVLAERHKAIAYITDGQKVPRNIARASAVYFLTRLHDFKIDRVHIDDMFAGEK